MIRLDVLLILVRLSYNVITKTLKVHVTVAIQNLYQSRRSGVNICYNLVNYSLKLLQIG